MTSNERMKALILNRPMDRVPFVPLFLGYLAVNNGVSLYDFFKNPTLAFHLGVKTMKKYPWANIRPMYGWGDHGAWEFGGKIAWPEGNQTMTPYTPEPIITRPEELDRLPDPEPPETEWFQGISVFNELCFRNGFSTLLPSGSIMAQMASIVGSSNLIKWSIKEPEAVHHLAKKVLSFNTKMATITIQKYGAKNCSVMTELPLESNDVISPQAFKEFCLPYITKIHEYYFESGVKATMIHLCGDHSGNLVYLKQVPLPERTIFSISESMDLQETGEFLGDRYVLGGNIPTSTLQWGTREELIKEVKRCLEQAKGRAGGFILMPGCEAPPLMAEKNLDVIRETLMEYGTY